MESTSAPAQHTSLLQFLPYKVVVVVWWYDISNSTHVFFAGTISSQYSGATNSQKGGNVQQICLERVL